jgi:hypothetical protein
MKKHEARVLLRWNALTNALKVPQGSKPRSAALQSVITHMPRHHCLCCNSTHDFPTNKWNKVYCIAAGAADLVNSRDGCGYVFRSSPSDGEPWLRADALLTFKGQRPVPTPATRTEVGWVCSRQYQVCLVCLLH